MKRVWSQFAAFLKAEEVPRWFGLSLVLIYLVGLATVANIGIRQARRDGDALVRDGARFALDMLGNRVAQIAVGASEPEEFGDRVRREFGKLAGALPVGAIELVENGRVLVAWDRSREGAPADGDRAAESPRDIRISTVAGSTHGVPGWRFLIPIRTNGSLSRVDPGAHDVEVPATVDEDSSAQGEESHASPGMGERATSASTHERARYLYATVFSARSGTGSPLANAGMFSIILVVLGALLVVYRCVREQMRGVARIAERLHTHGDRIRDELSSLRIADNLALDRVTTAWNELVTLTQSLSEQVEHNEANAELTDVLRNSPGSALADAMNALSDGIIHIADDARLDYANASACRLMDWDQQEVTGTPFPDSATEGMPARIHAIIHQSRLPDGPFAPCSEIVESAGETDGTSSSFRVWVIPIRRQRDDSGCLIVIRDVSQQLRADKAREEFITQVTHELRTPLTNIRAYAETLSSGMFDDPEAITECYNVITKETRRLSRLIEDILSVSQLEVGSIDLELDAVDLKTLLTEAVRDVRGLADEKQIDVQLVLPGKLEPIRADRDKLAVVLNNLLGNAIKYTPADGNVVVGCQLGNNEIMLTVKDNGIGIDASEHGRVFEKFQRGSNPEVREETGTGIGLYTAREIVRRHGGDIELISKPGEGSTFLVRLPQRASRASSLSTNADGST